MDYTMITSATTMGQIQQKIDSIANNLSNASTTGYKSRDSEFTALLSQNIQNVPAKAAGSNRLTPNGIRMGTGAAIADTQLNMTQGSLKKTGRTLDFALTNPNQFFELSVAGSNGQQSTQYTRDGSFYLSPGGPNGSRQLVAADGSFVLGANGQRITIPANVTDLQVNANGTIEGKNTAGQAVPVGTIGVVSVLKPQLLEAQGSNRFTLPNLASLNVPVNAVLQQANGQGSIQQGSLEGSNVDMTREMTDLVGIQRAYELNGQALTMSDQMQGLINNIR